MRPCRPYIQTRHIIMCTLVRHDTVARHTDAVGYDSLGPQRRRPETPDGSAVYRFIDRLVDGFASVAANDDTITYHYGQGIYIYV